MSGPTDIITPAPSAQSVAAQGLSGVVAVLETARAHLSAAGDLPALRVAQVYIDLAIDAARRLQGSKSPLTTHADIAAARQLQGDGEKLHHRAQCRLADEVDAAQASGALAGRGQRTDLLSAGKKVDPDPDPDTGESNLVSDGKEVPPTLTDVGIGHKELHTARKIRDLEVAAPGARDAAIDAALNDGVSPSKAEIRRRMAVLDTPDVIPPSRRRRAPSAPVGAVEQHRRKLAGALTALVRAADNPRTPAALRAFSADDLDLVQSAQTALTRLLTPHIVAGTDHNTATPQTGAPA